MNTPEKKRFLIVTALGDSSLHLFFTNKIRKEFEVDVLLLSETIDEIAGRLLENNYTHVYIRYPFRVKGLGRKELDRKLELTLDKTKNCRMVDNLESLGDLYFEDKWQQYKQLRKFMPKTRVLTQGDRVSFTNSILKKRLSGKAKGIKFSLKGISNFSDYIVQDKVNIKKEYRINTLSQKIFPMVLTKDFRPEQKTVYITGKEKISKALNDFAQDILKNLRFDLLGLDIAEAVDGQLYLIEINRACLFAVYYDMIGINMAEKLCDYLK